MGKNQSASNLTNIIQQDADGSIKLMHGSTMLMQVSSSGAITTTGIISGSNALSASYAATSTSASYAVSATSASYATTASYADALTVAGTLTAQTLVVQTITSSVDYVTGSTRFGYILGNTHTFTGSMAVSGAAVLAGNVTANILLSSGGQVASNKFTTYNGGSTPLVLDAEGSTAAIDFRITGSTKMYINASGSVGIGTTSPILGAALNVRGDSGAMILNSTTANGYTGFRIYNDQSSALRALEIDYAGSSYSGVLLVGGITGESAAICTTGAYPLQLGTSNSFRMVITSGGSVGIGTTSPFAILTTQAPSVGAIGLGIVGRASDDYGLITFRKNDATTTVLEIGGNASSGVIFNNYANIHTSFATNAAERMRITGAGNVGIGTTSPTYKLSVVNDSGDWVGQYKNYGSNAYGLQIDLSSSTGATGGFVIGAYSQTGTGFFLKNNGNVGIGTASPGSKLQVVGNTDVSGIIYQNSVARLCYSGTLAGNQAWSINLNVGSQTVVRITAMMNHYGYVTGYGCARMSLVGSTPAFSEVNISDTTSGNGGAWTFSNGGSGVITISKSAGSYGGGGYFFIEVVGTDPQSFS